MSRSQQIVYRVLSLDRDMHRRELFFAQAQADRFEVFRAIDKDDPCIDERFDVEKGNAYYRNKRFSRGEMACTLSHLAMYAEFVQESEAQWLVVCEDDAVLSPDFEVLPEILAQGYAGFDCYLFNAYKGEDFNASGRQIAAITLASPMQYFAHRYGRFRIGRVYGNNYFMTVGYAIHRRMAERIVSFCEQHKAYWVADDFRTLLKIAGYEHNAIAHIKPRLVKEDPQAVSNLEAERNVHLKPVSSNMPELYPLVSAKQYYKSIIKTIRRRLIAWWSTKIL